MNDQLPIAFTSKNVMPTLRNKTQRRPWPFIKVCGIQTPDEAMLAISSGANSIGVLVGLTHRADDQVSPDMAQIICSGVHIRFPEARVVLVTHFVDPVKIQYLATLIGVDCIQIHDDMSVGDVEKLRVAMHDIELFKAVHIEEGGDAQSVIDYAKRYEHCVDGFLTDSKSIDPDGQLRIGGTGKRHDPLVGRALVQAFPHKPVILAGGLNDQNAESAVREIQPAGIDANSGLENADGTKNGEKIKLFAAAGRLCRVGGEH